MYNDRRPTFRTTTAVFILALLTLPSVFADKEDNVLANVQSIRRLVQQILKDVAPASESKTRLLFPFVTNQTGFDTGIVVHNTGLDSTGTVSGATAGTCTVYYFPASGPSITPQTTNASVPVGGELVFTISNGGNFGIPAVPGFQGYVEVACNFPFAHGFGIVSDIGTQKVATTIPALVLPPQRNSAVIESLGQ